MQSNNYLAFLFTLPWILTSCGSPSATNGFTSSSSAAHFSASSYATVGTYSSNSMAIAVNVGTQGAPGNAYPNEPTVSVTICAPANPANCQTISNVLLDTGSYGLRLFTSVITVPLVPIVSGSNTLAECVQYGDGSSQWGQVKYAYVQLAGEPKVAVPIMTINSTYESPAAPCTSSQSNPDTDPTEAGFNGILGVGILPQDCGSDCVNDAEVGYYYTCNGSDCSAGASVDLGAQVTDPISVLPTDNNGLLLDFSSASVPAGGVTTSSGTLNLGIQTRGNNTPAGSVKALGAQAENVGGGVLNVLSVLFNSYSASSQIPGFIDSGSSIMLMPNTSVLPNCSSTYNCNPGMGSCVGSSSNPCVDLSPFLCPGSTENLTATNYSLNSNGKSSSVSFSVAMAGTDACQSTNMVFSDLAGTTGSVAMMDWGLPFFFGKKVYVGFSGGTSSSLGNGPYWAY